MLWLGRCKQPFGLAQTLSSDSSYGPGSSPQITHTPALPHASGTTNANRQGFQNLSPPNPQLACSYGGPLLIPSCLGSVKASLYRGMGSHSLSSSQELHFLSVLFAIHRIIPFPFCKIIPTSILHSLLSPSLKHTKQSSLDPTVL